MTDKPILFSAPMVRAILAGRQTQTRRILKKAVPPAPNTDAVHPENEVKHPEPYLDSYCGDRKTEANPRGMSNRWCWWTRDDRQGLPTFHVRWVPGDRLWVREVVAFGRSNHAWVEQEVEGRGVIYRATFGAALDPQCEGFTPWKSSRNMPRWASRITLEVTNVRVERIQDISEEEAATEGWPGYEIGKTLLRDAYPIKWYANLWDEINGSGSWDTNPFVVALTFRRVMEADR